MNKHIKHKTDTHYKKNKQTRNSKKGGETQEK